MNVFVFGLGFSARAIVAEIRARHPEARFAGTTRSTDNFPAFEALGVTPHVFSGETPSETLFEDLSAATHLIVSIAPSIEGDAVLEMHRGEILAAPQLEWIGYLSTIGVYGDAGGAWIDESYTGDVSSDRARWRVEAEADWHALARQKAIPLAILRLAGIYGPGRSNLDKLRAGTAKAIDKPGQVFNRIHTSDIAQIAALAADRRLDGVFNVADDEPAPPQEVMAFAAALLGMDPPKPVPFDTAQMSPMARSFYADNKRVSNRAIKAALDITLRYPTYREGLKAVLEAERL